MILNNTDFTEAGNTIYINEADNICTSKGIVARYATDEDTGIIGSAFFADLMFNGDSAETYQKQLEYNKTAVPKFEEVLKSISYCAINASTHLSTPITFKPIGILTTTEFSASGKYRRAQRISLVFETVDYMPSQNNTIIYASFDNSSIRCRYVSTGTTVPSPNTIYKTFNEYNISAHIARPGSPYSNEKRIYSLTPRNYDFSDLIVTGKYLVDEIAIHASTKKEKILGFGSGGSGSTSAPKYPYDVMWGYAPAFGAGTGQLGSEIKAKYENSETYQNRNNWNMSTFDINTLRDDKVYYISTITDESFYEAKPLKMFPASHYIYSDSSVKPTFYIGNIEVSKKTNSKSHQEKKFNFSLNFDYDSDLQNIVSISGQTENAKFIDNVLQFQLADGEKIKVSDVPYPAKFKISEQEDKNFSSSFDKEPSGAITSNDTYSFICTNNPTTGILVFTLNLTGMGNDPCKRCCSCEIEEKKYKTVIEFTADEPLQDKVTITPPELEYEWQDNNLVLMLAEGETVTVDNIPAGVQYKISVESEDPCDENEYLIDNAEGTVGEDSEGNPQEETEVEINAQRGETLEEYLDRLRQRGYEALAESLKLENVEFTLQDERVKLGDLVTVDMPEFDFKAVVRVTGVKIKSQDNQTIRTISVGTPLKILRKPRI